ncbi:MAG: serine hydroxymethyltransferase [Candidatus Nezhaarchaeota archaeon]|nr:serine hydroxymethyltransferase [Candidatus Nezhaarchaeota archaeon]MCX8141306.1 serine hydroxymethyltransferase [Candidatus Nezhaarchaeota archaeon]MDW8049572.1 serine hydroxymethyltransferase [Nitrososphaerota archaeon]
MSSFEFLSKVLELTKAHDSWRSSCLNLIPSENVTSKYVRLVLMSDFGHRYAEGKPYKRYYCGTRYIDEVEVIAIELAKTLFKCRFASVKPISGTISNLAVFSALTRAGDTIVGLSIPCGGHISFAEIGAAGIIGLSVVDLPFDVNEMNVDVNRAVDVIAKVKPKLVVLGASLFLFPHPVRELSKEVAKFGGHVVYDGSHVLGLIAGGEFQDPLAEGALVLMGSTHKTFPGPQGGIVLSNNEEAMERIERALFPGLISNHHLHRVAALAVSLTEMIEYGAAYAKATVENSRELARSLYDRGFRVLCPHKGFTSSHQIVIDVTELGGGKRASKMLEEANIITNMNLLPWDDPKRVNNPSGLRLGVQEVTRLGMGKSEMNFIAEKIEDVLLRRRDPSEVRKEVVKFMQDYQEVKYCFDGSPAYKLIEKLKI